MLVEDSLLGYRVAKVQQLLMNIREYLKNNSYLCTLI